jgi:hypothetical protein
MLVNQPLPRTVAAAVSRHHHFRRLVTAGLPSIAHPRRSYAATATKTSSPASPFTVSDVSGIRVVARDDGGATTGLSIVLKAGSRYATTPGLAHLLDKFAWKVRSFYI